MAKSIGKLSEFIPEIQSWEDYIEQFEFYLEANNINEGSKKRSTLLTAVEAKIYPTIKSFCLPKAPKDVPYDDIIKNCKEHFGKPTNVLLNRVQFHKRDQLENESLQDFVRELRKLAQDCKFGGPNEKLPLEIMLRDRFVAGNKNEELLRYLCRRHEELETDTTPDGLSLSKALEIARNVESTADQQKQIRQREAFSVNKVTNKNKRYESKGSREKGCYRCGFKNHTSEKCFFKNEKCGTCSKTGHLSRACRSKQRASKDEKARPKRAHQVKDASSDEDISREEDSDSNTNAIVNKTNSSENNEEYNVTVEINSIPCTFEIDNGAHVSLINRETYKKIWPSTEPNWSKREIKLFAYGKKRLDVLGSTKVWVKYGKHEAKLPLTVTEGTIGPNLLGRNWFENLGIKITGVQRIEKTETTYAKMINEFPSLTSSKLEGHHGTPINIQLKEGAKPKFKKARRVLYALQEATSEALKGMETQGMLIPVMQSEWATPAHFVKKKQTEK
ncbi:unnamed protein product [Lasius platythorax]|uniref:CCHC-type domain-containing protein n=1 Tax=Lasius platythorax TaxID=488582 RepID=A0AAV2MWD5_9HYME